MEKKSPLIQNKYISYFGLNITNDNSKSNHEGDTNHKTPNNVNIE